MNKEINCALGLSLDVSHMSTIPLAITISSVDVPIRLTTCSVANALDEACAITAYADDFAIKVSVTSIKNSDNKYVVAKDSDFRGETNGSFKYIGTDKYVEIPHVIKGISVTSYNSMFHKTSVEGVKSINKNITNMRQMFGDSKATTLDLRELDMSNVTNMSCMFESSKANAIDLSGVDTSNATNMSWMFYRSESTTLDLSSFNSSRVNNMDWMFFNSSATKGYTRTKADAKRFNSSTSKPKGLTFKTIGLI